MKGAGNVILIALITLTLFFFSAWFLLEGEVIRLSWYDEYKDTRELKKALKSDTKVLILGDSQLDKWPLEHSLDKDLRKYFADREIGCINAAHYGFGPLEYLRDLKSILPEYRPDYILLFFYAGNDLSDAILRDNSEPKSRNHPILRGEYVEPPASIEKKVDARDDFNWTEMQEKGVDTSLIRMAQKALREPWNLGAKHVNPHILNTGIWKPDFHYLNLTLDAVQSKYGWYKTMQQLDEIVSISDSIDALLDIVIIPSNVQVDTVNYPFYRKAAYHVENDLLFSSGPQFVLYNYGIKRNVRVLDLLPAFKSYDHSSELYLTNDNHLSPQGHLKAFTLVEDQLFSDLRSRLDSVTYTDRDLGVIDFSNMLIQREVEIIRSDSGWYAEIVRKSVENGISADSQLLLDAIYMVDVAGDLK